jgi:hypothetical protein
MTLSSVDIGLPPWEIVGILTAGLALSSFALSGTWRCSTSLSSVKSLQVTSYKKMHPKEFFVMD